MNERVESWMQNLRTVETINVNDILVEAFKKIWDNKVSGLACVDEDGKLKGNVSASDLRFVEFKAITEKVFQFHQLYQPIKQFLKTSHDLTRQDLKSFEDTFEVMKGETMGTVLAMIVTNHTHRVFVVDDFQKPLAVISLCDVLQHFVHLEASRKEEPRT